MKKIPVIYWPRKGSVELNAKRIYEKFGKENCLLIPLKEAKPDMFNHHDYLVFGCSTVGADRWQDAYIGNPWTNFFKELQEKNIDLSGKKVALFGLGDQILYPDHYVDELATLKRELSDRGAQIVGRWPATDYEHTESRAVEDDHFVGLALDEHNQDDMSEDRIDGWVKKLREEFSI